MKKIRLTIGNKILGGFLLLILVFIGYTAVTIITVNNNASITKLNSNVINPTLATIKDYKEMVVRSKMLITNWVYLQSNEDDKEELRNLHSVEYPEIKEKLQGLMDLWNDEGQRFKLDSIFTDFEELLEVHQEIMGSLVSFEDYDDVIVKFMAEESIESQILPLTSNIIKDLEEMVKGNEVIAQESEAAVLQASENLRGTSIILGVIITIIGLIGAFVLARNITRPINYIKEIIVKLGKGVLPEDQNRQFSNDEIGEMAHAVGALVEGLKSTSFFAENIGNGKYDSEYQPLSADDVLGNALIEMRNNLKRVADEDKKRNWATEGLAKFGDILRKNNDNIARLSDEIISNLVKYTRSNQGGLFILNDDDKNEPYLELAACYAWDKKKYLEQRIYEGEGLTGQAWLEKDTIYMTDVPDDYVMITSGLGEANPNCILITPLKVNDEVYGVLEMASFFTFQEHEIEFVEKLAESIASTISSVKINERTSRLLNESRELTEQMRSQEEEMRQNMEELQATQEEMERGQRDRQEKEAIINSTQMQIELDDDFRVYTLNNIALTTLKYNKGELEGNSFDSMVVSKENLKKAKSTVMDGRPWSGVLKVNTKQGDALLLQVSAGRVHDMDTGGEKFLLFASDITNTHVA
jgi:HAMP domain-containing protein/putative methionine-R-sulfoxide reductase with GAF domain